MRMRMGDQNNNTVRGKQWAAAVLIEMNQSCARMCSSSCMSRLIHRTWLTLLPLLNHTEAQMFSHFIWEGAPFHHSNDNQVGWYSSPSSGSFWTLQPGNYYSSISILPIWNVSYHLCLHYSFLNPFPCLTHLFIPSCLVILLSPLFFPRLSFLCSQTIIHPPFILSFFYPPGKVHFHLFLPKSYYAPFSPCAFITPHSIPVPP